MQTLIVAADETLTPMLTMTLPWS